MQGRGLQERSKRGDIADPLFALFTSNGSTFPSLLFVSNNFLFRGSNCITVDLVVFSRFQDVGASPRGFFVNGRRHWTAVNDGQVFKAAKGENDKSWNWMNIKRSAVLQSVWDGTEDKNVFHSTWDRRGKHGTKCFNQFRGILGRNLCCCCWRKWIKWNRLRLCVLSGENKSWRLQTGTRSSADSMRFRTECLIETNRAFGS